MFLIIWILYRKHILWSESRNTGNLMFSLFAKIWWTNSNYLKTVQLKKERSGYNSNWYSAQASIVFGMKWIMGLCIVFTFCFLVRKMHHRIHALNTDIFQGELFCFYSCSECKMNASNVLSTQRLDAPFLPSIVPVENRQHYAIWWPGTNNENASPWLWEEKQLRG